MNLSVQDTKTKKDFFSWSAQDFSTRLLGAWGGGLVFVEIIWKLGENWVFHKMLKQQALFVSCNTLWEKKLCIYLLLHKKKYSAIITRTTTCLDLDWNLSPSKCTKSKHALSLLIKRDYLQHDWPKTSTKDITAPEKSLAESYQHKMKWKLL